MAGVGVVVVHCETSTIEALRCSSVPNGSCPSNLMHYP